VDAAWRDGSLIAKPSSARSRASRVSTDRSATTVPSKHRRQISIRARDSRPSPRLAAPATWIMPSEASAVGRSAGGSRATCCATNVAGTSSLNTSLALKLRDASLTLASKFLYIWP